MAKTLASIESALANVDVVEIVTKKRPVSVSKKRSGAKKNSVAGSRAEAAEALLIERAVDVIGDRQEALRWLGTPVRALGYATPVSLLATPQGRAEVLAALSRLEHGVL